MPKQKTHSGAKKKYKVTATGRLLRRPAMKAHLLEKKSPKRKQGFDKLLEVSGDQTRGVKRLLGGFRRTK